MQTVTLEEAKARPEELFGKVQAGEEVLITSQARPFARLLPVVGDNGHAAALTGVDDGVDERSPTQGIHGEGNGQPVQAEAKPNEGHAHLLGLWKGAIEFRPGWDEPEDFGPDYQ